MDKDEAADPTQVDMGMGLTTTDKTTIRTLITGGTGFIGSNLAEYLSRAGRDVMIVSRSSRADASSIQFAPVDVLDLDTLRDVIRRFQPHEVVHLAAASHFMTHDDPLGYKTNVEGTANVLECVSREDSVRRCLLTSSHVVNYGNDASNDSTGRMRYADSKRDLEKLIVDRAPVDKVCVITRPCSIWGPGFGEPYFQFFMAIARGRYFHLGSSGAPKRLGYIGNVTFQIAKLLDAPPEKVQGRTFYLADYDTPTIQEWANTIAEKMGRRRPWTAPESLVRTVALAGDALQWFGVRNPPLNSFRLENMRRDTSDLETDDIRAIAGPLPYTMDQGVETTVAWLREKGHIR